MTEQMLQPAKFRIDSLPDLVFDGFSDGDHWNGWACPYFSRQEAERVLKASTAIGFQWTFDEQQNAFSVRNINDPEDAEPESFEGIQMDINGKTQTLYGVGAYSWIWEFADKQD